MTGTVLFFTYSNKYICADRIEGVRRYAEKAGWSLQVVERNNGDRQLDVKGIVEFWNPIGVIAECGGGVPEMSVLDGGRVPVVYLDEEPLARGDRALYVNSDSARVGELAAKEMLSLNLPHYGFVGWRLPRFWSEERKAAYTSALSLHGRDCIAFDCPPDATDISRCSLLAQWLAALPKPCGVFAANDPVAENVLSIAASVGISVPRDLAVIGVDDDLAICERTKPTLSSIRLDFERSGRICAELLDSRLGDPDFTHPPVKFGPVQVMRRWSTRRTALDNGRVTRAIAFIRRYACDGIGNAEVAAEMGLSRRMAEIAFMRCTGHTIHCEIANVRMERVERLLLDPQQDMTAIAGLCGWISGSALRKAFKERHDGLSMREWRAKRLG
jgi:LacI family transcriptional regulator